VPRPRHPLGAGTPLKIMKKNYSRNITICNWLSFLYGLTFYLPILALYFEQDLFTTTNVAIIFSVQAISLAIFEIPTGIIADFFGRKITLVLDGIISLLALIFLYVGGSMTNFIIFAVLEALAMSLSSGAINALIYDTLNHENRESEYKKVIGKFTALWPLGAAIASVIGGHLATYSLNLPVLYTFIPYAIAFIAILFVREVPYEKEENTNVVKHFNSSLKTITSSRTLVLLFLGSFIFFGFEEGMHQLKPIFLKFKDIDIIYFGYISFFTFILSSLGHWQSDSVSKWFGDKYTIIISTLLIIIFLYCATLTTGLLSAFFLAFPSVFFGIKKPPMEHMIQQRVPSHKRATILSAASLFNQMSLAIAIPIIGYLTGINDINIAFQFAILVMILSPLIYLFIKEK
jgi:MFS family permease